MISAEPKPARSTLWYIAAALVALAGIGGGAGLAVKTFLQLPEPPQFVAPGRLELDVAAPGTQVIWLEYRTLYRGKTWDVPDRMPGGAQFQVVGPDGRAVAVESALNFSWKGASAERQSVAQFAAAQPGRYVVAANGEFEPRVLSVGPTLLRPLLVGIGAAVAIAVGGLGVGVAVALYAFLHAIPPAPRAASVTPTPERERSLRQLTAIVYGLQAASLLVGITLIAAVILNYLKRGEVAGTWLESHFRWQIRTFWWMLGWTVLGFATVFLLVGIPLLLAAAVWLIYRIVRGWGDLNDGVPIGASKCAGAGPECRAREDE